MISICIPTYNTDCTGLLKSLNNQIKSLDAIIEIIVIDDRSPDNSMEVLKSYEDIKNVTIIENEENHESKYLSLDISKAISKLHWKPTWTTREAIKRTALWYLSFYENQNPSQLILKDLNLFLNYD